MTRFLPFLFLLLAMPALAAQYHPPRSDAEKALEHILLTDGSDEGAMQAFLTADPGRDPRHDADYTPLFTSEFVQAVRDYEKKSVEETCGGEYKQDEVCGFGASYVTCGQEVPEDPYVYDTASSADDRAVITGRWAQDMAGDTEVSYRMVKKDGQWLLDGVSCTGGTPAFHP